MWRRRRCTGEWNTASKHCITARRDGKCGEGVEERREGAKEESEEGGKRETREEREERMGRNQCKEKGDKCMIARRQGRGA